MAAGWRGNFRVLLIHICLGLSKSRATVSMRAPTAALDLGFINSGPLAAKCGFARPTDVPADRWAALADVLFDMLELPPSSQDERVHRYYLPVYFWLRRLLDARPQGSAALCVGLQCVQGGGKSTLVGALESLFLADGGKRCVVASLDDFYLPREDLDRVASEHSSNRLLQVRGAACSCIGCHPAPLAPTHS